MQRSSYTVGIVGTIIIHLLVVVLFLEFSSKSPPANPAPNPTNETPVNVVILSEADAEVGGAKAEPLYTADGKVCPPGTKTYLGIGIVYEMDTGEITQAPSVLPAFKAGIRVGDLLLNNPFPDAAGMMYPKILRGYEQITFEIKTTQVCYMTGPITSV